MKILITGASGFIGSFLVEEALKRNMQVWAGVRQSSSREYLKDERISFIDLPFYDKDKLKLKLSEQAVQTGGWDYIVHNAGVTKSLNVSDFYRVNYHYTKYFIESLIETGLTPKKFLLMSSLSAQPEPDTEYGKSKLKAERFIESKIGFPYIIFRPTGVYGPRDRDYLLMMKTVCSGWDFAAGFSPQRLTFIYVKDLVKAAFLAIESDVERKTYNIADGDVYSDSEYTEIIRKALGKKHLIRVRVPLPILKTVCAVSEFMGKFTGEVPTLNNDKYRILKKRDWTCDTQPLVNDLAFKPDYDLQRGIEECRAWYRAHHWL
jgi:nucleoside-diphosphate-sugar epimerase